MPWKVEWGHSCPAEKPWAVVQADGTRMGCHATEDDAKAQQAALYAKEGQRVTTEVQEGPTDQQQPREPAWMARLRWRAVELDDIHIRTGDGRTVVAYAAVFDQQAEIHDQDGHYRERIAPAAFDKTLAERAGRIGVYYNHAKTLYGTPSERWSVPLGVPVEMRADKRGLLTVTRYDPTPDADQILAGIKSGSIRGMSFTGAFLRSDPAGPYYARSDGGLEVVTRHEIAMSEYGPTPIPAYEDDGAIVGVRSQPAGQKRERIEVTSSNQTAAAEGTPAAQQGTAAAESTAETTSEGTTEPPAHSEAAASTQEPSGGTNVAEQQPMTVGERTARQEEIRSRMNELATHHAGSEMPADVQTEWDDLSKEYDEHDRAVKADNTRRQRLQQLAETQTAAGGGERVDAARAGYLGAPAVHVRTDDVYDIGALRQRARSIDELPALYRENAHRALEQARFPGQVVAGRIRREDAQQRVAELLDSVDVEAGPDAGALARRILVTGSPLYERAFFKYLARGGMMGLTTEEQRALSMGSATSAQLAVPFTLDPTVILTSDGSTNPLRAISRVETITGRAWEGVTSAGITVSRAAEAAEASDNAPALAQPTVTPTRVQGFVPFSIESDQDWSQLRSEMTRLLQDAKDVEEATSFVTGNGTPPNPSGVQATLTSGSNVNDGNTFDATDIYGAENALPPRFSPGASWLARKNTYNLIRALDTNGTLYVRLTAGRPQELIGYPAYEASAMPTRSTTGNRYAILGDFQNFIIVDKAGMDVELIPHLFHTNNNLPTGQRGLYAIWRNNSAILVPNAFRILTWAT